VLAACQQAPPERQDQLIGLSTSLPLLWREAGDIRGQLAADAPPHWALALLEKRGHVVALDTLAGPRGVQSLPRSGMLVLVQPRPLMPEENVALDAWVRGGGRLLLFADPMLTTHSDFALGDPRGPERTTMLSPILRHWGLDLRYDPTRQEGERSVNLAGVSLPVNVPGQFAMTSAERCRSQASGVVAECTIGAGRLVAIGDAAVFDGDDAGRAAALGALLYLLRR
jgi:hypothetical protein